MGTAGQREAVACGQSKNPPASTGPWCKLRTGPQMRLKALSADLWPDTFTAAAVRDYCEHEVPAQGELLLHLAANYCQGPRLEQITVQPALCLGLVLRRLPWPSSAPWGKAPFRSEQKDFCCP